jgi:hypothetical protein
MADSSAQSPLARLVLFMVCLAIIASIVAGVFYFTIEGQEQNLQQTPENSVINRDCADDCLDEWKLCIYDSYGPMDLDCDNEFDACYAGC